MKLPSMQFYPGDWLKDPGICSLSCEERGLWFHMLLLMFESDKRGYLTINGKPMKLSILARQIGLPESKVTLYVANFVEFGVASIDVTGAIYNRRMVRDEEKRVKAKEYGDKGGNPILKRGKVNPMDNPPLNPHSTPQVKPNPTPSSSSSSSDNSPTPFDEIVERTVSEFRELHPKASFENVVAVFFGQQFIRLGEDSVRFAEWVEPIHRSHLAWCAHWQLEGGKYAEKLEDWLAKEGWKKSPPRPTAPAYEETRMF